MPVHENTLTRAQRSRFLSLVNNLDDVPQEKSVVLHPTCAIEIVSIRLVYTVATNGGTIVGTIQVGIPSDPDLYADITPAASQAINTLTSVTPLSSAIVPAGTALQIINTDLTGTGTNTGEVAVVVEYRLRG